MRVNFNPNVYSNKINFNGNRSTEKTTQNSFGFLIHETCFFRERRTDDIIKEYILKNFPNEPKVKIINGACSTGEETYTQAMLYYDIKDKVKISGFDISPKSIAEAKKGKFTVYESPHSLAGVVSAAFRDSFLIKNSNFITNRESEQKELFSKFFTPVEYQIYPQKQQDFQANDEIKALCNFEVGDIKNLSKMYDKNSIHVLTFRNAIYLLICWQTSDKRRLMISDAKGIVEDIARQAYEVLKPNGLFVFGQNEEREGIDTKMVYNVMTKNGFEPAIEMTKNQKKNKSCSVWKKVCRVGNTQQKQK